LRRWPMIPRQPEYPAASWLLPFSKAPLRAGVVSIEVY
jgi:hypothetical protein